LKAGLALGSSSFLWIMAGLFAYDPKQPPTPQTLHGFRVCASLVVGSLFLICAVLLAIYKINQRMNIQMADELNARRMKLAMA